MPSVNSDVFTRSRTRYAFAVGVLALTWMVCVPGSLAQTTLLVNFDKGFDAAFAAGDGRAQLAPGAAPRYVRLAEGRFGKGVFIDKDAPGLALSYAVEKHIGPRRGTLEFFFRPEWSLADAPKIVTLLSSYTGGGTGFRLMKNQYNWFGLFYSLRYKVTGRVMTQYGRRSRALGRGRWMHVAVSWDEAEARLFVNGMLTSVSDFWRVAGGQTRRFGLGCRAYGQGLGGGGTFDELRLSADKKYVASFPVLANPLGVDKLRPSIMSPADPERARQLRAQGVLFFVDFSRSLVAEFARGDGRGGSNRSLVFQRDARGRSTVRLHRRDAVGDVVYFRRRDNLNPFLGTAEVCVRFVDPISLPAMLFDVSDLAFNHHFGHDRRRRTGFRLWLTRRCELRWECLEDKRVVGSVTSPPLDVSRSDWHRFAVSWAASRITLRHNDTVVARSVGQALPSSLPNYFFVGSQSTGEDTLDGWVDWVRVSLADRAE